MQFIIVLIVAIVAFAGGVWYANEYDFELPIVGTPQTTLTTTPNTNTGTNTPQAPRATYHNADANLIVVSTPQPGATVPNTFTVSGQARGNWYFEANFPIEVVSATGTRLVQSPVQAQGEWMTTEFVPFSVQITVPANYQGPATLILHNDNASGLPENARSISIPIVIQ
ncbi:MAG TPA: Gmad2 immunoglobulin-like domain-containing protein [Candidatus Paceibacterota bacterium]|nr:Gmad2 immunoglobulin-like domain-containing protein [Candidatus Paceibacterota bacterium]